MEEEIKKNPVVMKWKLIGLAIFLIFTAIIGGLNYGIGSTPEEYILDETNFQGYTFQDSKLAISDAYSNKFIFIRKSMDEDSQRSIINYQAHAFEMYSDCENKITINVKIYSTEMDLTLEFDYENNTYIEPDYSLYNQELDGSITVDMSNTDSEEDIDEQIFTLPFNKKINSEINFIIVVDTSIETTASKIYFSFEKSVE